jgi:hypothetical protein
MGELALSKDRETLSRFLEPGSQKNGPLDGGLCGMTTLDGPIPISRDKPLNDSSLHAIAHP